MNENIFRDEIIRLLFLSSCFGAGNKRVWELVRKYGSLDEVYREIAFRKPEGIFLPSELKSAAAITGKQLREIILYCHDHNIGIIGFDDTDYPPRLRGIFNPPPVLFCKGDISLLFEDIIIAVVGARNISDYSKKVTEKICTSLSESGIVTASGFAVGTDITAHLSAVRSGGKTIAVLGAGIGYDYPAENMQYYSEIEQNGLFISEYFPQTSANHLNFPMRNRILAGIAMGTAVIEASEKSGSLNTASHAIMQGRDLWVVPPHDIFDSRYKGNSRLISDGAIPLLSVSDIPCEYFENYSHKPVKNSFADTVGIDFEDRKKPHTRPVTEKALPDASEPKERADTEKFEEESVSEPEYNPNGVDREQDIAERTESVSEPEYNLQGNAKIIYDIIRGAENGISPDEISEKSGIDIDDVLMLITDLEIEGAVYTVTGQDYFVK